MADELEKAPQPAPEETPPQENVETPNEEPEKGPEDQQLNNDDELNAEIEEERKRKEERTVGKTELDKAKFTREKIKKDLSHLNQRITELGGEPDDLEGSLPEEKVRKIVEETIGQRSYAEEVRAEIRRTASSPKEAELAILRYENRIVPSGNPAEDAAEALFLARRKKLESVISEQERALRSEATKDRSPVGGGGGQKPPVEDKPRPPTLEEKRLVDKKGWIWHKGAGRDGKGLYGPQGHVWDPDLGRFKKK